MTSRRARASVLLLWLVACGGGGTDPVPPDPCAIPADGSGFLLFTDARSGDFEIRAVKQDGTCDQLVGAGPDYDLAPSWSGSAALAAWAGYRAGSARIVVQPVPGGAQRVLDTGSEPATGPALSPDGKLVAFERLAAGATTGDVYVVPVAGGTATPVADGSANDAGPVFSFSSRGNFVYFVSSRSGPSEVWRVAVGAGGVPSAAPEQVTTDSQIVGKPAVSSDGRFLAFATATATVAPKVMIRDLDTGDERILSDQIDTEPAFDRTGTVVAVKTGRFSLGNGDLVLLDFATGALVKRLTDGSAMVGAPAFPR